jgi:hypothetical protein
MIKRPAWAKDAYPTERGWKRGRELLTARRHTPEEVAEWMAANAETPVKTVKLTEAKKAPRKKKEKVEVKEAVLLSEAPVSNKSIGEMTLAEAEALSNQYNVKIEAENNVTLTESSTPSAE